MENCVSFIDMPYRMAGEQPEHFAQYLIQTISRGGNPSTYIMGVPGAIPYPSLRLAAEITRFHDAWSHVYTGLQPTASVGLVRPNALHQSRERHHHAVREMRGLYSALQERHIPFDVVPLEGLADMAARGDLQRYTDLVLPDVGVLDESTRDGLEGFTDQGGRLLLTGRSAFDSDGKAQLKRMPARSIVSTVDNTDELKSAYIADPDAVNGDVVTGRVIPVYGEHHRLDVRTDAEPRLSFLPPAPYGPPEKAYGHLAGDVPGYITHPAGITIVPWTIGYAYHELGLTSIRDHFVEVLEDQGAGEDRLRADLPEHVELTVHRRGSDLVVHLLNFSGRKRKSFGAPSPVAGGRIRLRDAAPDVEARTLVTDAACETWLEGKDLIIRLPDIARFEVLVIRDASGERR